jgi:hypothetical protein
MKFEYEREREGGDKKNTRKRSRRMWSGMGERSEMSERLRTAESMVRETSDGGVFIHSLIKKLKSLI